MTATTEKTAVSAESIAAPSPTPFSRLLRVEGRKTVDTRAARWLLMLVLLATVAPLALPVLFPEEISQTMSGYLDVGLLGMMLLFPVVAILAMTTEWTQRTVLTTFTQEPRRGRVLGAKVLTISILTLVGGAATFVLAAAALGLSGALGRDFAWEISGELVLGLTLFLLANTLMAVGFGAVLHNTAAAIVLFYMLPMVWSLISLVPAIQDVARWLDTERTFNWMLQGNWDGHVDQILVSVAVWVALPLVAGVVRTLRREVK